MQSIDLLRSRTSKLRDQKLCEGSIASQTLFGNNFHSPRGGLGFVFSTRKYLRLNHFRTLIRDNRCVKQKASMEIKYFVTILFTTSDLTQVLEPSQSTCHFSCPSSTQYLHWCIWLSHWTEAYPSQVSYPLTRIWVC